MTVHVVGAGLAGLAASVRLAKAGRTVVLHEAAGHAGGRCRSFLDANLDRVIDNGTHLILSANPCLFAYLDAIGGRLVEHAPAQFPFFDLRSGAFWTIRPNAGPIPWWIFSPTRRVAGTKPGDYLGGHRLVNAPRHATVAERTKGPLADRLWKPLAEAVLNTSPAEGQARLLGAVIARTLMKGERHCRPYSAPDGLSAALVEPALETLSEAGAELRFQRRLIGVEAQALIFENERLALGFDDRAILALPSWVMAGFLPMKLPAATRAIVNAHFRLDRVPHLPGDRPYLGLVGGAAQWLAQRGDVLSVTVSAADALVGQSNDAIATTLWRDCARVLGRDPLAVPPVRVLKERRATLAHTPAQEALRPKAATQFPRLVLAGDWTATGLPSTLEGAVQSGFTAADLVLADLAKG
ncbi:MAG: FAD-dependent oxidoreductase [Rhodospirillales bacterium]|nr:FAD-dependent oxidoreductase [Rhodospirillales bacterium]